jgi:hypothetical protein
MAKKAKSISKHLRRTKEVRDSVRTEEISQELNTIFKARWHGAINIRGIRFQILYSLLCALSLYDEENLTASLCLEGIEDLDLVGFYKKDEFIQVKSSDKPWKWNQLKKPLEGFLPVLRSDDSCNFVLAVNFSLTSDIERLSKLRSLPSEERNRVEQKFNNLCAQVGYSKAESTILTHKLTILSVPESEIWQNLKIGFTENFGLGSEAVETYILTFVSKFLEWAKDRRSINRLALDNLRGTIGEALARETEFQAYGQGLINRITWSQDEKPEDFFNGKGTRSGHIFAGLDIVRPTWLEKIDASLNASKICILRSSSGQGKSTLLYRYAYKRASENIFVLRVAETPEQVEMIRNYLLFRASLGLPILLLIDDVRWQTRLWALITQQCAALNIQVLVTIRDEDWHRFAQESLSNYEILEPKFNLGEARDIFKLLQLKGKISTSVSSPEWAYEKIGSPHLLIEYVYLVTQGQMLEDRLRDQLRQFSQQQEDPAKIEILRRTTLAHTLGTPVLVEKLFQDITFRVDPQQILQSLLGEYLHLEDELLIGLHWVRSNLLAQILHEKFPTLTSTALATIEAIPSANIATFISNAICKEDINPDSFLTGIIEKTHHWNIDKFLIVLNGIFEAGERNFFQINQGLFDEAHELIGSGGEFILGSQFLPIIKVDIISNMIDSFGEKAGNFKELQEISTRIIKSPRGIEISCVFLNGINPYLTVEKLMMDLGSTGQLLDWYALCKISISNWKEARRSLLASDDIFNLPIDSFCIFLQGIYRYDEQAYQAWFLENRVNVICYLKLHLDCIQINLVKDAITINFFPDGDESLANQTMTRLNYLKSAIPFCSSYQSQAIWLLPFGLQPSVDDTQKNIPQENLHFRSDIAKNVKWRKISQKAYLPNSRYEYEESWYKLRQSCLALSHDFLEAISKLLSGRKIYNKSLFENGQLLVRLEKHIKYIPSLSEDNFEILGGIMSDSLKKALKDDGAGKWVRSFQNFFYQIIEYIKDQENSRIGHLALHNFKDARKHLRKMHHTFGQLFLESPDYFNAVSLNSQEEAVYSLLSDLLEIWIIDKPKHHSEDILQDIKENKKIQRKEMLCLIDRALDGLRANSMDFILPDNVYTDYPIRYLPIAFSVDNPCHPEIELCLVIAAISKIRHLTNFFCLIPIFQGNRFLEGGYQISSSRIVDLLEGRAEQWETFALQQFPEGIWQHLPDIKFCPSAKQQLYSSIYGVINKLKVLRERQVIIEPLQSSQNAFEIALYDKHNNKANEFLEEIGTIAGQIIHQLDSDFSALKIRPKYKEVRDFLEEIKTNLDLLKLDEVFLGKVKILEGAIEQLLAEV